MTGKGAEANREKLARLAIAAVKKISKTDLADINVADIKVETVIGESAEQSELVDGIVLDKERAHLSMPEKVEKAKIALLDVALEIKNIEIDAKVHISDPSQLNAFMEKEEQMLRGMVEKIKESGANVLFCQRGIDDLAQHFLAKAGIMAARRVRRSDMNLLAKATGAKIISSWKELTPLDIGSAGIVKEKKLGEDEMLFVERCLNPKAVTLLVKGATEHVAEETKRAVMDALGDVAVALKEGKAVGGAGSVEMELAKGLRAYAGTLCGREQLAVQAFAEAMEVIPRTLAENAGLDPIDSMAKLRAAHDQQQKWAGINVLDGKVINAWEEGIIEPLKVKTQALSSAAEVAEMILRIDDVILGNSTKKSSMSSGSTSDIQM
jgi:chaperonin GroEL (HSP60 family)